MVTSKQLYQIYCSGPDIYRLSVFSAEKFSIFTTYPWRHYTDRYSGSVMVVLNIGNEETFILDPTDKKLTTATYWWCLEFVAETPQLVTRVPKHGHIKRTLSNIMQRSLASIGYLCSLLQNLVYLLHTRGYIILTDIPDLSWWC